MITVDEFMAYSIRQETLKQIAEKQTETLIRANAELASKVAILEKKIQDLTPLPTRIPK